MTTEPITDPTTEEDEGPTMLEGLLALADVLDAFPILQDGAQVFISDYEFGEDAFLAKADALRKVGGTLHVDGSDYVVVQWKQGPVTFKLQIPARKVGTSVTKTTTVEVNEWELVDALRDIPRS